MSKSTPCTPPPQMGTNRQLLVGVEQLPAHLVQLLLEHGAPVQQVPAEPAPCNFPST